MWFVLCFLLGVGAGAVGMYLTIGDICELPPRLRRTEVDVLRTARRIQYVNWQTQRHMVAAGEELLRKYGRRTDAPR